jgi:MFS family permease
LLPGKGNQRIKQGGEKENPMSEIAQKKPSPFFNRQFVIIFIIAFWFYYASQILALTLPKYANEMGAVPQAIGLLAGIFAICALCMRPFSGQIVDNENRKVLLRIVLLLILASMVGFTFAKNYWLLVVFRGLNGLAWGVGSTLCMTIATDCFSRENMAAGVGIYGLGQTIAQTLAPMLALPLVNRLGYNMVYLINVLLILLCLVLTRFMKYQEPAAKKRAYSISLKNMIHPPALLPASLTLCGTVAKASILAFLVIFAGTMNIQGIGLFFTIQAASVFAARLLISKMADKYGLLKLLIPCEILAVTGLAIISCARSLPVFLFAAVLMGISTGGEQPILMAECVKSADSSKRGRASNTSYVGTDIGNFLGSNLAGALVAAAGYRVMFLAAAAPIVLGTAIFVILHKKRQAGA